MSPESCIPLQVNSICVVSVSQGRCSPDTRRKVYTAELLSEPCEQIRLRSPLAPHLHKYTPITILHSTVGRTGKKKNFKHVILCMVCVCVLKLYWKETAVILVESPGMHASDFRYRAILNHFNIWRKFVGSILYCIIFPSHFKN